jgi:hypothetical protein
MTMKTTQRLLLTLALVAAAALPARAYDAEKTHRQLTVVATEKSVLYTDPAIMSSLLLLPADRQQFNYYVSSGGVKTGLKNYSLSGFLAEGAYEEDYPTLTPLNHFFDPVYNRGLTVLAQIGHPSWEWMTEPSDISGQDYSLRDARWYLGYGLMYTENNLIAAKRQRDLGLTWMLRSLGHAMHHMQDMAQPQHVRNDQHLDYHGVGNPSRYEHYTAERGDALLPIMQSATPIFPYAREFKVSRDFWFNGANTGIAQTVNRDFLSQGTNFRLSASGATTGAYTSPQPEGSTDYTVDQLFGPAGLTLSPGLQQRCGIPGADCTMTMYSTLMTLRASTLSIFDQDLRATGLEVTYDEALNATAVSRRFFDLNRFNFDDVYGTLMLRAVSYSAGLVNHFFRGKLEASAPATGPYSVVDQSTGEGFRKIRMTVKNLTYQEALGGGTIRLIAKYHLNNCYKPDLTGEFRLDASGNVVTPCPDYESAEEHLSLSLEQTASFDVDQSKQFTFTLIDPIPLNATDLRFQVYYTGTVGEEADSFALGAVDVSEPTFLAEMNGTDTFELNGAFYYWQDIVAGIGAPPFSAIDLNKNGIYDPPNDVYVNGGDMAIETYINGLKVAEAPAVPQGRFSRLALIVDVTGFDHQVVARGQFNRTNSYHFPAKLLQYDAVRDITDRGLVSPLRNDTLQFASTTLHAYYPAPSADIATMPKSLVANSTVPVPMQLTSAVLLGVASPADTTTSSVSGLARTSTSEPTDNTPTVTTPTVPPAPVPLTNPTGTAQPLPAVVDPNHLPRLQ